MNGLPTSLRLGQPRGRRLTYSPHPTSVLEEILGGVGTLAGTAEQIRQQRRQKEIVEAIMGGEEMPAREAPERAKSTLGKILQVISAPFDPRRPPMGPVPLEETIAEVMLKQRMEPKTAKEKLEEKLLAGEELTNEEKKLIGAYISPEEGKSTKDIVAEKLIAEGKMTDEQALKYIGARIPTEEKLSPEQKAALEIIKGTMRYRTVTFGARPLPKEMQISEKWAYELLNAPYPGSEGAIGGEGAGLPSILEAYQKLAEKNKNVPVEKWNRVLTEFLKKHNMTREQLLGYMDSLWGE